MIETWLILIPTALVGLCVGSFLNVVIHRLPIMLTLAWQDKSTDHYNLATPRSRCPQCQRTLPFWTNIPVVSYLWLRGRCFFCDTSISLRYPLIELSTAVIGTAIIGYYGLNPTSLGYVLFAWSALPLIFIDLEHQLLPDHVTLTLLWLGLLANAFGLFCSAQAAIFGAALGYVLLWCIAWLFKRIRGIEGLGQGDFKCLAMIGAWVGYTKLPMVILLASLLGTLIGGLYLFRKKLSASTPLPFGPCLLIAGFVALLWKG